MLRHTDKQTERPAEREEDSERSTETGRQADTDISTVYLYKAVDGIWILILLPGQQR